MMPTESSVFGEQPVAHSAGCRLCSGRTTRVRKYPCAGNVNPLGFHSIEACASCDFAWAAPVVPQSVLDVFYESRGYWTDTKFGPDIREHNRIQARVRVAHVRQWLEQKPGRLRILDVGAGYADIASELYSQRPAREFEYFFVEPDDRLSADNLTRLGSVSTRRIDGLGQLDRPADLVFLNHVLEHTADPVALLQSVVAKTAPDGIVYVEVPNRDDEFKLDVFPHTVFFSPQALAKATTAVGLRQVALDVFGGGRASAQAGLLRRVRVSALSRVFRFAAVRGLSSLTEAANRRLIDYGVRDDGIWIRGVFRKQAGSEIPSPK